MCKQSISRKYRKEIIYRTYNNKYNLFRKKNSQIEITLNKNLCAPYVIAFNSLHTDRSFFIASIERM
jgi:hypothetical protein